MNAIQLHKEQITSVPFPKQDVLMDEEARKLRKNELERAMLLGNAYKSKTRIYFKSEKMETFSIEAAIWSVGDQFVTLKGGIALPLTAITRVEV